MYIHASLPGGGYTLYEARAFQVREQVGKVGLADIESLTEFAARKHAAWGRRDLPERSMSVPAPGAQDERLTTLTGRRGSRREDWQKTAQHVVGAGCCALRDVTAGTSQEVGERLPAANHVRARPIPHETDPLVDGQVSNDCE